MELDFWCLIEREGIWEVSPNALGWASAFHLWTHTTKRWWIKFSGIYWNLDWWKTQQTIIYRISSPSSQQLTCSRLVDPSISFIRRTPVLVRVFAPFTDSPSQSGSSVCLPRLFFLKAVPWMEGWNAYPKARCDITLHPVPQVSQLLEVGSHKVSFSANIYSRWEQNFLASSGHSPLPFISLSPQ